MIPENELRIGNWMRFGRTWRQETDTEIRQWTFEEAYFKIEYDDREFEDLYPIPLTPEILEKAGFVVQDDNPKGKPMYQGDVLVTICGFEFSNSIMDDNDRGFYCWDINEGKTRLIYVHQLQNLYFALTGEELEIEL